MAEMNRRRFMGVVTLVAATAGCPRSERNWTLNVASAYDEQSADGIESRVEIAFGGQFDEEDVVTGVRVCALDENGAHLESTTIDRMSPPNEWKTNVTLVTDQVPVEIVLDYGAVETDAKFGLQGLRRREDGVYSSFHQEGPRCGR